MVLSSKRRKNQEIESYFETLAPDYVKYEVTVVDGQNDMYTQAAQIKSFVNQKVDAIICNLVDAEAADEIITLVHDAGIPLVLINREPVAYGDEGNALEDAYPGIVDNDLVCYVGCDPASAGYVQGQMVARRRDKGDMNGDGVTKYVMIQGDMENPDAQYRNEYAIKALTDAGIAAECLAECATNWFEEEAYNMAKAALQTYGSEIDVIFCHNDFMAIGAAAAIEEAGRTVGEDILLLGIDAVSQAQMMVLEGTMTGTVLNDYEAQARTAVKAASSCCPARKWTTTTGSTIRQWTTSSLLRHNHTMQ